VPLSALAADSERLSSSCRKQPASFLLRIKAAYDARKILVDTSRQVVFEECSRVSVMHDQVPKGITDGAYVVS
jgi:hypothetical protein